MLSGQVDAKACAGNGRIGGRIQNALGFAGVPEDVAQARAVFSSDRPDKLGSPLAMKSS